ncbi:nitroreductase family deazaflavin-dependent oxidoreductase [Actinomadura rupiterrae]|uniref:nitroreductase family deazaflavin-dependent oxidoreductase n=1 Tax=Actinomadura rupiterrae TaxID=559627 RepID=UPI0020A5A953|nr:nitroreductase family deazaflavin-dependent oxidoreductase [Actinomadura rupiterrae]MCP2336210.1 deazaflavin-dependent oxidoreductase (nitroreductase family) [Actinomadura rupiterrae]
MPSRFAIAFARLGGRTATFLGPGTMRAIARFNKYATNPVQRLWAPRLRNYAVIEHKGRKSGRVYETPVMVLIADDQVLVMLNYGPDADWVRNIQAAGTAVMVHRGKRYDLRDPRVLPADSPDLPAALRVSGAPDRTALISTFVPA